MKRHKILTALVTLTSVLASAVALQSSAFAVEWDFATANAQGNYQTKLDEQFATEVAAATHDQVKINIHAGGQLGFKGPEMLSAIRDGLVPIGSFQFAQQVGISPILGASSVPYLVSGFDQMKIFRAVSKPYYDAEFKKFNQKLLFTIPWPGQNVFSKVTLSDVDVLKHLKIRTTDGNGSDFFRSLGASPAQIPWGEVVPALSTGVINSVSTSTSSAGCRWSVLGCATEGAISDADVAEFVRTCARPHAWRGPLVSTKRWCQKARRSPIGEDMSIEDTRSCVGAGGGTVAVDTMRQVAKGGIQSVLLPGVGHYAALGAPNVLTKGLVAFIASVDDNRHV